jgi:hypothetical protein
VTLDSPKGRQTRAVAQRTPHVPGPQLHFRQSHRSWVPVTKRIHTPIATILHTYSFRGGAHTVVPYRDWPRPFQTPPASSHHAVADAREQCARHGASVGSGNHIRPCTVWERSKTSATEKRIDQISCTFPQNPSEMLATRLAQDCMRPFQRFYRSSPFFIDMPALADALMGVDDALDDSHGHRRDRRRQQRAILVDVKEVRAP